MKQENLYYLALLTNEHAGLAKGDLLAEVRVDEANFIRLLGIHFYFCFIDFSKLFLQVLLGHFHLFEVILADTNT